MKIKSKQIRSFKVSDTEDNTSYISLSLSSETPVQRSFGNEILLHGEENIDMSRTLPNGLPLFVNHDDISLPVGRLKNIHLDASTKKMRGDAYFSGRPDAQSVKQDVLDGIVTDVSVGYMILDHKVERSLENDGTSNFLVTRWKPYEVSLVGIPADLSVGVGRSELGDQELEVKELEPEAQEKPKVLPPTPEELPAQEEPQVVEPEAVETPEATQEPSPEPQEAPGEEVVPVVAEEETRSLNPNNANPELYINNDPEVLALRNVALNLKIKTPQEIDQILKRTTDINEARKQLLNSNPKSLTLIKENNKMLTNETFKRSLGMALQGRGGEIDASVAGLIQRSSSKEFTANLFQTRADSFPGDTVADNMTTTGYGSTAIYPENIGFLELLRARNICFQAGAKSRAGAGSMSYWRQTVPTVVVNKAEDSGVPQNSYIDGVRVPYVPHALTATVVITDESQMDNVFDLQEKVKQDMVLQFAQSLDYIMINGVTTPYTINGLLSSASGIQSGALSTAGVISFAGVNNLKALVDNYAVDLASCSYITTPGLMAVLETTPKFSGGMGWPIADGNKINGYNAFTSSHLPVASGTNHSLVFGDFRFLEVALMGPTSFVVDTITRFDEGITTIKAKQYIDVGVLQPNAFAGCLNIHLS